MKVYYFGSGELRWLSDLASSGDGRGSHGLRGHLPKNTRPFLCKDHICFHGPLWREILWRIGTHQLIPLLKKRAASPAIYIYVTSGDVISRSNHFLILSWNSSRQSKGCQLQSAHWWRCVENIDRTAMFLSMYIVFFLYSYLL